MKIKMRYDNTYQTLEVDAEEMWVSLSLEAGSNISHEKRNSLFRIRLRRYTTNRNTIAGISWTGIEVNLKDRLEKTMKRQITAMGSTSFPIIPTKSGVNVRKIMTPYARNLEHC